MAGLLYKDFVSIKGKKLCFFGLFIGVLFVALRILFPGYRELADFMMTNEQGELVNLVDAFFSMVPLFLMICLCGLLNGFVGKIVEDDEKHKIMNYVNSMPIGKNTYVAAKYVFLVIAGYVCYSYYCIISVVCKAFCGSGPFVDIVTMADMFAIGFLLLVFLSASIELPLFLCLGLGKGMFIKISILLVIAFGVMGYLFFGDLSVFERWDVFVLIEFMGKHMEELALLQVFSILGVGGLYYLSYRITCFGKRREEA